ncbi:MAG TPA: phosphoribosyltransferase [Candidatus Omnitrophica bacterium]|nr:phosphoribosyltransferase [Candidatus Omnitrophota bacterium]
MGNLHILSHGSEPFSDRKEAGGILAQELKKLRLKGAVVLGIPRGGIIVALEVARALEADMDIVLSRKLGAPFNPELAIGSIGEDGHVFLNEDICASLDVDEGYIQEEKTRQAAEINRRAAAYRAILPRVPLEGRTVIVTDDGIATGATMQAALWAVGAQKPLRLIAALPVGPPDTLKGLASSADEIICLRAPAFFSAVGQFYARFSQVEDAELLEILKKESARKRGRL